MKDESLSMVRAQFVDVELWRWINRVENRIGSGAVIKEIRREESSVNTDLHEATWLRRFGEITKDWIP